MEISTAIVLVAAIGACVTIYAISAAYRAGRDDRRLKHAEFNAALEPTHRETLAKLAAQRDAEIAKATSKEPSSMLDMKRIES